MNTYEVEYEAARALVAQTVREARARAEAANQRDPAQPRIGQPSPEEMAYHEAEAAEARKAGLNYCPNCGPYSGRCGCWDD